MPSNKVDLLDIRLSSFGWKNELPGCPAQSLTNSLHNENPFRNAVDVCRFGHRAVAIPGYNGANDQMVVLGGCLSDHIEGSGRRYISTKSVQCLAVSGQKNPLWRESSFPNMNAYRVSFGSVYVEGKLYAFGGNSLNAFEVLDFDDLSTGWELLRMPSVLENKAVCKAVVVDNRWIYALFCEHDGQNVFCSYDTQSRTWNLKLKQPLHPCKPRKAGFNMTSICIPGEGTYVILLGEHYVHEGDNNNCVQRVQAYRIESKGWTQLPHPPDGIRDSSAMSSVGNRYVVAAGGHVGTEPVATVIGFDWDTKDWFELPSLPAALGHATGAIVAGNKWVITGGAGSSIRSNTNTQSLDISIGIGWAKEKQLLLCFRGKARRNEKDPACPLEGLESGVFANILSYLFVPFPHELECKGSIFAGMKVQTSSGISSGDKRGGSTLLSSKSKKIRGTTED